MNAALGQTLALPDKHPGVPENARWLAGEGAGSWFIISPLSSKYRIAAERWSPSGQLECHGHFTCPEAKSLDLDLEYQVVHLSHCSQLCIEQNRVVFLFRRTEL